MAVGEPGVGALQVWVTTRGLALAETPAIGREGRTAIGWCGYQRVTSWSVMEVSDQQCKAERRLIRVQHSSAIGDASHKTPISRTKLTGVIASTRRSTEVAPVELD